MSKPVRLVLRSVTKVFVGDVIETGSSEDFAQMKAC